MSDPLTTEAGFSSSVDHSAVELNGVVTLPFVTCVIPFLTKAAGSEIEQSVRRMRLMFRGEVLARGNETWISERPKEERSRKKPSRKIDDVEDHSRVLLA